MEFRRAAEHHAVMSEIEDSMKKITQPDYEVAIKKLLMMNQKGIYLMGRDGHVWIETDNDVEYPIELKRVILNNKIYGGVFEAIDTLDSALEQDGQKTLLEMWNEWGERVLFFGEGGVDKSRIDIVAKGKGGIY